MKNVKLKKIIIITLFFISVFGSITTVIEQIKEKIEKQRNPKNSHNFYGIYEKYIKRPLDLLLAMLALIVFLPIIIIISLFVYINLGFPIIFKQERPGKNEKIFKLYKFRTMNSKTDKNGNLLPDSKRLTKFGKTLRSTSLDELPELFNIIKGDMSIVGPRPQLIKDMVFMSDKQRERHFIRPGLSGLAQVNGRNAISWEKKLEMDLEYLDKITFWGDLKIILYTVINVFQCKDINEEGYATALDLGDYLLKTGKIKEEEYIQKQKETEKIKKQVK